MRLFTGVSARTLAHEESSRAQHIARATIADRVEWAVREPIPLESMWSIELVMLGAAVVVLIAC